MENKYPFTENLTVDFQSESLGSPFVLNSYIWSSTQAHVAAKSISLDEKDVV